MTDIDPVVRRLIEAQPDPAIVHGSVDIDLGATGQTPLPHQYVREIRIHDANGGNPLFDVDRVRGFVAQRGGTHDLRARAEYEAGLQRIDLIFRTPDGSVELASGPEFRRFPSFFTPSVPAGATPLYRILRWPGGHEACVLEEPSRPDAEDAYANRVRRQRKRLSDVRERLGRGGMFRLGAYGDSLVQLAGPCKATMDYFRKPNGPRDRVGFYALMSAEEVDRLLAPVDLGDGFGKTAIRHGVHWRAIGQIEKMYDIRVEYRNWGVSGTRSCGGFSRRGYPNGSEAGRLSAVAADGCDLVHVAFGHNDLGARTIFEDHVHIGRTLLDSGAAVILVCPARRNPLWQPHSYRHYVHACREIARAADELGVACVQTLDVLKTGKLGRVGLTERELCEATLRNHTGPTEANAVSDMIADLLAPTWPRSRQSAGGSS